MGFTAKRNPHKVVYGLKVPRMVFMVNVWWLEEVYGHSGLWEVVHG